MATAKKNSSIVEEPKEVKTDVVLRWETYEFENPSTHKKTEAHKIWVDYGSKRNPKMQKHVRMMPLGSNGNYNALDVFCSGNEIHLWYKKLLFPKGAVEFYAIDFDEDGTKYLVKLGFENQDDLEDIKTLCGIK